MKVTQALGASVMACIAVLCVPALSIAADRSDSPAKNTLRASAVLASGSGYGQPQGEPGVRALQRRLRALGHRPGPVDGLYGPLTEAAVERLQRDSGLSVDGIVGPQTRRVLNAEAPPLAPGAGYGQPGGSSQVREVQRRLRALGQRPGPVDGHYGPRTQAAVERFQRTTGKPASGVLSPATAVALAGADRNQPTHRASDSEPGRQAERRASRTASSGADDRADRADGSRSAGASGQPRTQGTKAADDRSQGNDEGGSTAPVVLLVLALGLAAIGLLATWSKARRRGPQASGVVEDPVRPKPMANRVRKVAKATAGSTVPSSPDPIKQRNGTAALGYVSAPEPEAEHSRELLDQMDAIDTACGQRGLMLDEVVTDLGKVKDNGSDRPGLKYALQRLAAGEASCLVVSDLGQLSGSAPDVGHIVERLRRQEARLVAIDDGLDTGTSSGGEAADKLVFRGAFDERPGASAPTGGSRPVRVKRPTEEANGSARLATHEVQALKERIQAMRGSGMTLQAIADRLNAENVPTLRGGTMWRPSGVQAAAGYRRPGRKVPEPGSGADRDGDGSSGGGGGPSWHPASNRGDGARR